MAGRKAKPISVHLAEGNKANLTKEEIRKRQEAEEALRPATDKIERPAWLDPLARKTWDALVQELMVLDLITNVDVYSLAIACDAYSNYVKAAKDIRKEGQKINYTNAAGATNKVANPSIATGQKYFQTFKSLCAEFGLTPAARARLALPRGEEEEDEFGDEFD